MTEIERPREECPFLLIPPPGAMMCQMRPQLLIHLIQKELGYTSAIEVEPIGDNALWRVKFAEGHDFYVVIAPYTLVFPIDYDEDAHYMVEILKNKNAVPDPRMIM